MYKTQILHAFLVKNGLQNHVYQCNLLLQAYIKSQALSEAHKLISRMSVSNVVSYNTILSGYFKSGLVSEALKFFYSAPETDSQSWNIIISGCVKNQRYKEALTHFVKMRSCGTVRPDEFTYSIVIPCCGLGFGQQVHAEIVKVCSDSDAFLGTSLLRMYAEFGDIVDARKVFDGMSQRDLVTWNALIDCYFKAGMVEMSIKLFLELGREGVLADEYTYSIVLNVLISRLQVFEAMQVHSIVIRSGFCSDGFINNALVDLYSKCGFVASAAMLFEEMPDQDVVSWTTIIDGLAKSGCMDDAMWLFYKMRLAGVNPNSFTFGCLLSACAVVNAFQKGKQLQGLVLKFGLETNMVVGSAVADMYSKCGEMDDALRVFQSMPERDIVSWNGIICGYAQNGEARKALNLYTQMLQSDTIAPNDVTFIGVLSACSHTGLVKEGYAYFSDMIQKYNIKPKPEHYTCMVDLLGRAGLVEGAEALILELPFKPDVVMWGALLGACKLHGHLEMARRITKHLHIDDELWSSSNYVLLANSYTCISGWNEALEIREAMDARGVQKKVGCSWIEIGGCLHSFVSGDMLHFQIEEVYEVLLVIFVQMDEMYCDQLDQF